MIRAQRMLETHPSGAAVDIDALVECIEVCFDCAQACTACAGACLGEEQDVQMLTRCIRLDLDCADVCAATGGSSPAKRTSSRRCRQRSWKPAPELAASAAMSVRTTPNTPWSTAGSAPKLAVVARAPATTSSPR